MEQVLHDLGPPRFCRYAGTLYKISPSRSRRKLPSRSEAGPPCWGPTVLLCRSALGLLPRPFPPATECRFDASKRNDNGHFKALSATSDTQELTAAAGRFRLLHELAHLEAREPRTLSPKPQIIILKGESTVSPKRLDCCDPCRRRFLPACMCGCARSDDSSLVFWQFHTVFSG